MGDRITVDAAEVREHAAVTDGFAGRADTAAAAGTHLTSLDDAYGLFCQPFGAMLVEPQERGTEALERCAGELHKLTESLNSAADAYEERENETVAVLQELLDKVDAAADAPALGGVN